MPEMTESLQKEADASLLSRIMSARHDPAARILNVDLLTVLVAVLLPWTTTGVSIVPVLWAIAFVVLVLLGMSWSEGQLTDRMHQLSQVGKLLALPLLIYHFARSQRGMLV